MNPRRLVPILLACAPLFMAETDGLLASGPEAREDSASNWTIESIEAEHSGNQIEKVTVYNPLGEIRVRRNDSPRVRLVGNAQRPGNADFKARFHLEEHGIELRVEPRFVRILEDTTETVLTLEELRDLEPRRRIDMTLLLPVGVNLQAEVLDDRIQVRGLEADLELRSQDGDLDIAARGTIEASTRRGRILADLGRRGPESDPVSDRSNFKTESGDIYLWFDWHTDARVGVDTAGRITSDVTIEIERPNESLRKLALAEIGPHRSRSRDRSVPESASSKPRIGLDLNILGRQDGPSAGAAVRRPIGVSSVNGNVHLLLHTP